MGIKNLSWKWLGAGFLFLLFATFLVFRNDHFSASSHKKEEKTFQSMNPALNFTFQYPLAGWVSKESKGATEQYDAVQVLNVASNKDTYRANISIAVRQIKEAQSSQNLLESSVEKMGRFRGFKILERKDVSIQNRKCPSATLEYYLRIPFWEKNAKDVRIKEIIAFIVYKNHSYRISCSSTSEQFTNFSSVFERLFESFKFNN